MTDLDRLGVRILGLGFLFLGFAIFAACYFHMKRRSIERTHDRCSNIYRWVCFGRGESLDPSGSVIPDLRGDARVTEIRDKFKKDHPEWSDKILAEAFAKKVFDPKSRERLISAYHWTLHALENYLSSQPNHVFSETEKLKLILRLREVKLELPPPASLYSDDPVVLYQDELFYQRIPSGEMRLRIGGAYLFIAQSWFNLIFSFAHELSHVIDPCEIHDLGIEIPAYRRIRDCLTDHKIIRTIPATQECEDKDQISEAFADWLGMEITAEALSYFSTEFHGSQVLQATRNAVRDLCEQEGDAGTLDTQSHPAPRVRIERIFGRQPLVRQILGCPRYRTYNSQESPLLQDEGEQCTLDYVRPSQSEER